MKYALITGSSSGIGMATAWKLASKGINLLLCARRYERLEALKAEISSKYQIDIRIFKLDVTDREQVETELTKQLNSIPQLDYLVNNSGLAKGLISIDKGEISDWDQMIDTNLKGLLYITKISIPFLEKSTSAQIVNIGSIAGHEVYPGGNVYCATKFAVKALTQAMRIDLMNKKIKVSTIDPGMVETEFSVIRFAGDELKAKSVYQGVEPLTPEDIADTILWILERPKNVQVAEIILLAGTQASATQVLRE